MVVAIVLGLSMTNLLNKFATTMRVGNWRQLWFRSLLFFSDAVADNHMQLINILVGAYVAVLAKSTDFWFKEKDDPETKEGEEALANGH